MRWLVCLLVACSAPTAPSTATAPNAPGASTAPRATGPIPIVDSHVHLAFYPVADQLAANGVRAVVDLASPESALDTIYRIDVIQSGPMLTRPGGYPLNSWGRDGYGIGCDTEQCIGEAIARLHARGARVIKIALDEDGLDPKLARHATALAHQLRMKVAVHALRDSSVRLAAELQVDVLAHTPLEPMSRDTLAMWRVWAPHPRAVISTLAAFGGSDAALDNLDKLRKLGVTVLYGTDLGNLRVDGVSEDEVALLRRVGLDDAAIKEAMTTAPWQFWGFDKLTTDASSR